MLSIQECLIKSCKKKKKNATNFYEKLEKEISDLVRYSTIFLIFNGIQFFWGIGKKKNHEKEEKMENVNTFGSTF